MKTQSKNRKVALLRSLIREEVRRVIRSTRSTRLNEAEDIRPNPYNFGKNITMAVLNNLPNTANVKIEILKSDGTGFKYFFRGPADKFEDAEPLFVDMEDDLLTIVGEDEADVFASDSDIDNELDDIVEQSQNTRQLKALGWKQVKSFKAR